VQYISGALCQADLKVRLYTTRTSRTDHDPSRTHCTDPRPYRTDRSPHCAGPDPTQTDRWRLFMWSMRKWN